MDSTHEKEPVTVGILPENILAAEIITPESSLPTITLDTPTVWYKNKKMLGAIALAVVLLGGAGGYTYYMQTTGGTMATVNGTRIFKKDFDESVKLIEQNAVQQGADISDVATQKEIRDQALEVLINNTLLISAAKDAGFVVTDEDIQKKYDELVEQLGSVETLALRMSEVGLTEEKLRANIAERILSDLYIESVTPIKDLSVSDEEINEFMKSINTGEAKLPPLAEIRPQIEQQILGQKRQQIVDNLLAKLRKEGEIEIKL